MAGDSANWLSVLLCGASNNDFYWEGVRDLAVGATSVFIGAWISVKLGVKQILRQSEQSRKDSLNAFLRKTLAAARRNRQVCTELTKPECNLLSAHMDVTFWDDPGRAEISHAKPQTADLIARLYSSCEVLNEILRGYRLQLVDLNNAAGRRLIGELAAPVAKLCDSILRELDVRSV